MNIQEAVQKLYAWQSKLSAYNHAMSIIYYDGSTVAPKKTAENRAHALAILSEEMYKLTTNDETVSMLEFLDEHSSELEEKEQRIVYLACKGMKEMKKIPLEDYIAYEELLVKAGDVWHTAKETDDFALFCPYLEKVFEYNKKFAHYCAPDKHPYDYCLDQYEKGLNMEKCDEFFSTLKERLVPLIKKIGEAEQVDDSCIHSDFDEHAQEKFSLKLMEMIGIDLGVCGLGTTEHPFTTSIGSRNDVRITTNYQRDNFASSMFSVIHEGGHALYEMHTSEDYAYTYLDGGVSMGIHESQSRFYENLLGRSEAFVNFVFPSVVECFPEQMKGYTARDLYRAINLVQPSLIRTEADEVTYCLHVMVRYELEKRVMSDELEVKDLASEWKKLYKEYLGVEVPNDREGVLQDSHWSGGSVGYFPSYALGSAYGAHLLAKMSESVDIEKCLSDGNFEPINAWNEQHIWKYGCLMDPNVLLEKALGEKFDPMHFINYLEEKYSKIYNI